MSQLSLLRVLHKRTQFDAKLRTVAGICGPDFEVAVRFADPHFLHRCSY